MAEDTGREDNSGGGAVLCGNREECGGSSYDALRGSLLGRLSVLQLNAPRYGFLVLGTNVWSTTPSGDRASAQVYSLCDRDGVLILAMPIDQFVPTAEAVLVLHTGG